MTLTEHIRPLIDQKSDQTDDHSNNGLQVESPGEFYCQKNNEQSLYSRSINNERNTCTLNILIDSIDRGIELLINYY